MEEFRQEVRALNTQFAAYVSRQSRENGDKLWESGLRDYLTYAAKVRQEYKDVLVATGSSDPSSPAGNIFVMGQGDMNQLGLGEDVTEVYVPTVLRIEGGLRVTNREDPAWAGEITRFTGAPYDGEICVVAQRALRRQR